MLLESPTVYTLISSQSVFSSLRSRHDFILHKVSFLAPDPIQIPREDSMNFIAPLIVFWLTSLRMDRRYDKEIPNPILISGLRLKCLPVETRAKINDGDSISIFPANLFSSFPSVVSTETRSKTRRADVDF